MQNYKIIHKRALCEMHQQPRLKLQHSCTEGSKAISGASHMAAPLIVFFWI